MEFDAAHKINENDSVWLQMRLAVCFYDENDVDDQIKAVLDQRCFID